MSKFTKKQISMAIDFWNKQLAESVKSESEEEQEQEKKDGVTPAELFADEPDDEEKPQEAAPEPTPETTAPEPPAPEPPAEDAESGSDDADADAGEPVEEAAPGTGKYEPNTVGAVVELLKKFDPESVLMIRLEPAKKECLIVDISGKLKLNGPGVTYMDIAFGSPAGQPLDEKDEDSGED